MKKIFTTTTLMAILLSTTATFAQMNPADLADRFMLCTDTSQTQQLMVLLDKSDSPQGATYIKTAAPGTRNIQEMVTLNVLTASYNKTQLIIEAQGVTDANRMFAIQAQSIGEHNITPTLKTTVYTGQMQATATMDTYMCVVLDADQLSEIAP